MGFGITRNLNKLYTACVQLNFTVRKYLLGFENANGLLRYIDKRVIIPILCKNGAAIGEKCDIESPLIFHNCKGKGYSNLEIGNNCHIGKGTFFDLRGKVTIRDNVVISMRCNIITHIDMSKSDLSSIYPMIQKDVIINNNCYLGANSTILMGVELGENCLVTAGSVVTGAFPSNSLIGGVPAKLIKKIEL